MEERPAIPDPVLALSAIQPPPSASHRQDDDMQAVKKDLADLKQKIDELTKDSDTPLANQLRAMGADLEILKRQIAIDKAAKPRDNSFSIEKTKKIPDGHVDDSLQELIARVDELATRVKTEHPLRPYFIAEVTDGEPSSENVAFKEMTVKADGTITDFIDGRVVSSKADAKAAVPLADNQALLVSYKTLSGMRYALIRGGGGGVGLKITSATATVGKYNAKSITPGTGTASSYGTLAATEDLIVWCGSETAIATINNLLASPNTATFDVVGSGVVTGVDEATGKRVVVLHMAYAGCEDTDEPAFDAISGGSW